MKGYFSRLADRSGLNFERGRNSAASGHEASTPSPPDIEEIAFTSSQQVTASRSPETVDEATAHHAPANGAREAATVARESKDVKSGATVIEISQPDRPPAIEQNVTAHTVAMPTQSFVEESYARYMTPESKTTEREGRSKRAGGDTDEREAAHLYDENSAVTANASAPETRWPQLLESVEVVESLSAGRDDPSQRRGQRTEGDGQPHVHGGQPQPIGEDNLERSRSVRVEDEGARSQATFQDYLREVREWVSAPTETLEQPLGRRGVAGARATASLSAAEDGERVPQRPSAHGPAREEPEVLDMNLSIGTISVVIEEQMAEPPTPPAAAAPHGSDGGHSRPSSEPTSLSRYYLRSW